MQSSVPLLAVAHSLDAEISSSLIPPLASSSPHAVSSSHVNCSLTRSPSPSRYIRSVPAAALADAPRVLIGNVARAKRTRSAPIRVCIFCGFRHASDGPCPCMRCQFSHPGSDCVTVCGSCHGCHPKRGSCAKPTISARHRNLARSGMPSSLDVEPHFLGTMSVVCPFCRARTWPHEKLNCCGSGSIVLEDNNIVPHCISEIILSVPVRSNIRAYNSLLAFTSVGHKDKSLVDGTFVLSGKSYHRMGTLQPLGDAPHCFAQIFLLDTAQATQRRLDVAADYRNQPRPEILQQLHDMFLQHNHLAQTYRAAASSDVPHLTWQATDDMQNFDVGAILSRPGFKRDIVVTNHSGRYQSIWDSHQYYQALAYPLLFPTGLMRFVHRESVRII